MNFFQHQETAKRNTLWLLVMFALGVASIILVIDMLVLVGVGVAEGEGKPRDWNQVVLHNLPLLGGVSAFVGLLIGGASLFRLAELGSGGGASVAEMLGGRVIPPETIDPTEKKILNIVEEMAIASGVPVPRVYLLEEEGINAFAAGWSPGDAVIGITRGCVEALNRDELQGVVAHEFSHILHGDMRLNIRLMGLLFGIFFLSVIGETLLRSMAYSSSSDNKKNDGKAVVFFVGLLLFILGWLGYFFGRLIQAAISRQREFLADSSAVQFTRNPQGIGNALRKIAGWDTGSRLKAPHAAEASHLFFGNAISGIFALFATHPPLQERIQRIEGASFVAPETSAPATTTETGNPMVAGFAPTKVSGLSGTVQYPAAASQQPPEDLTAFAREPAGACALLLGMLLSSDPANRKRQLNQLLVRLDPLINRELLKAEGKIATLPRQAKIPILSLAVPSLKMLSKQQSASVLALSRDLIQEDGQVDFFEFCVWRIARMGLEAQRPPRPIGAAFGVAVGGLFAAFAELSSNPEASYFAAIKASKLPKCPPTLAGARVNYQQLDKIMDALAGCDPVLRERIFQGLLACAQQDGRITLAEADLLRATCMSLQIPLPPLS